MPRRTGQWNRFTRSVTLQIIWRRTWQPIWRILRVWTNWRGSISDLTTLYGLSGGIGLVQSTNGDIYNRRHRRQRRHGLKPVSRSWPVCRNTDRVRQSENESQDTLDLYDWGDY